jgi:hypothetical protein
MFLFRFFTFKKEQIGYEKSIGDFKYGLTVFYHEPA